MGASASVTENREKVSILIVDDQRENLLALEAILEALGENLVTAESGMEALRQVLKQDFAAILLDVRMPGMDGFETAKVIHDRPASHHTPILLMTAHRGNEQDMLRAYAVGALDYLLKPFEASVLRTKVALCIELKRKSLLIQQQSEEIIRRETERRQLAEARLRLQEVVIAEHQRFETDLAHARDQALEAARAKSEFLANMSHEIRTPLNAVLGLTGLLSDTSLSSEQKEMLRDIERSGEALLSVVNDVLDFSKMSAGKLLFEEIDLDLVAAIEDSIDLIAESARAKNLELITDIEAGVPRWLRGDPGRVRQVLLNLLSNAVKFTEKGEIAVRVGKVSESVDEATLRFEIRDTGIGIPPQAQGELFNPFYQVDPSSHRRHGGTGLGLAIAAQLVQRMGGEIGVASTPGAGSKFSFTIRLKKPVGGHALTDGSVLSGVAGLIVDDNPNCRAAIQRMLVKFGMRADVAGNAAEGIAALRARAEQDPYGVAIVDLEMSDASGVELANWIRNDPRLAHTRLLLASSVRLGEQERQPAALGLAAFLLKPLKQSALFNALVQILSGVQVQRAPAIASPGLAEIETRVPEASAQMATPSGAPEPQTPSSTKAAPPREARPRILVAEDNTINLKVALRQVSKLGYEADGVGNGREALNAIGKIHYDAILMDCQMPEMDGYEATEGIRQREQKSEGHVPVIAMTAHALEGDRQRCLDAGMDDYISKPVSMERLSEVLKRYVSAQPAQASPAFEASPEAGASVPEIPSTASSPIGEERAH